MNSPNADVSTVSHPVVSRDRWVAERKTLLAHEKELTRLRDHVARERRVRLQGWRDASAREIASSGSLTLALTAMNGHTVAMLAGTGVIGAGDCRGFDTDACSLRGLTP